MRFSHRCWGFGILAGSCSELGSCVPADFRMPQTRKNFEGGSWNEVRTILWTWILLFAGILLSVTVCSLLLMHTPHTSCASVRLDLASLWGPHIQVFWGEVINYHRQLSHEISQTWMQKHFEFSDRYFSALFRPVRLWVSEGTSYTTSQYEGIWGKS